MITLGSRVCTRNGSRRIIGVVVALRGVWIEVLWPNGETSRHDEDELVEVE